MSFPEKGPALLFVIDFKVRAFALSVLVNRQTKPEIGGFKQRAYIFLSSDRMYSKEAKVL